MSQWPFVLAAYTVVTLGTAWLALASLIAMRRAERAADTVRRR